jgi:AcrR family transcriptional regulator
MARRSDHSRGELTKLLLVSARRFAEEEGLSGIGARRIARDVGYTAGTIYNVFGNLDGLIMRLREEALDEMHACCAAVPMDDDPAENLHRLAAAYTGYVVEHPRLWSVLFEHQLPGGDVPDGYQAKVMQLLALVERAIAPLFAAGEEHARHHEARVLWSSLHGIVSLEVTSKVGTGESVLSLTESLIGNYVFALTERKARSTSD